LFLDSKLKPKGGRLTFRDDITKNGFDYPKFGANVSNFVLMPKKTGDEGHYNFFFFLNHVLVRLEERQENTTGSP
jgi:hypothetical protein